MRNMDPNTLEIVYQVRDLTKEYNGRRVLEVQSLDIHRGEVFSLVGPSGSGKSTLLRLLNFLEFPTTGNITFEGKTYQAGQDMPLELRRKVTTVFQRPVLLDRSVWDNVVYGLQLRKTNHSNKLIQDTLEEVGLANLARQRARTLSGGEAQRVALARAMVVQPEVLLLDEPTANLDPYNVGLIESITQRINSIHGTTVVLVTHNIFQAKRLAARTGFVLDGKIIEVEQTGKFFDNPVDPRTAAFVRGEMVY
jgi:tungstate transport system ATP-binding protein